ncbi:hypothetical protein [Desulforamulus ruminis]|uniref:Amidoligase enzyme n=1 Tax=Desulforamulus ruminis (strain ATCC 23193 / DSM 2154 / NCIMB 8452 / DL) TaxID=696281 RepID=F6DTW8_DESRL|nr:hypothetical protein [Desulforamulus ruminis]AEG58986.1 hypothetical protein Desru_0702 [Desulforamulus ruminis DSM 2154]
MLEIKGLRLPTIKCVGCGAEIPKGTACRYCMGLIDTPKDYSYQRFSIVGKKKKNAPAEVWGFGVEIETLSESPSQLILLKKGFTPCIDSTVTLEWKSPIFQSLLGFKGICKTIEEMDVSHGGSHVHVSVQRKDLFQDHYEEIFHPLADFLYGTSFYEIWGRRDTSYCNLPGSAYKRHSWVNVNTNYSTIEWRLPKFVSAEQYYNLVKWLTNVTWGLDRKLLSKKSPRAIGNWLLNNYQQQMAA